MEQMKTHSISRVHGTPGIAKILVDWYKTAMDTRPKSRTCKIHSKRLKDPSTHGVLNSSSKISSDKVIFHTTKVGSISRIAYASDSTPAEPLHKINGYLFGAQKPEFGNRTQEDTAKDHQVCGTRRDPRCRCST